MFLVVLNLLIFFYHPLQCGIKVILPIAQLTKHRIRLFQVLDPKPLVYFPFLT